MLDEGEATTARASSGAEHSKRARRAERSLYYYNGARGRRPVAAAGRETPKGSVSQAESHTSTGAVQLTIARSVGGCRGWVGHHTPVYWYRVAC